VVLADNAATVEQWGNSVENCIRARQERMIPDWLLPPSGSFSLLVKEKYLIGY
jgi:hypothetical protein